MDKTKRIVLTIVIVFCIILGVLAIINFTKKESKQSEKPTDVYQTPNPETDKNIPIIDKKTKETTEAMLDNNLSSSEISKKMGIELSNFDTYMSKDSFLRQTVSKNNKDKIKDYVDVQNKYASRVEDYIKNNTTYTLGTPTFSEKNYFQTATIKPYYYQLYEMDLNSIMSSLLVLAGYDLDKLEESDYWELGFYKAKIKAMEILDSHLDKYLGTEEDVVTVDLVYQKVGNEYVCQDYRNFLEALKGAYSPKGATTDVDAEKFVKEQKARVDSIMNETQASGLIDNGDPLKLTK